MGQAVIDQNVVPLTASDCQELAALLSRIKTAVVRSPEKVERAIKKRSEPG